MFEAAREALRQVDDRISSSTFGRVFRLHGSGHERERKNAKFLNEIRAGLTTFFTMAYIIAVNSTLISQTGGTCVRDPAIENVADDAAYSLCKLEIKRDLVTATAAVAGISSMAFGFLTNLPVALGPGMGLNAYFTYQVVGVNGEGPVPYRLALTAVFIEGFVFVFLSLIGLRQWLVKIIPGSIKVASGVGIGLFLTTIGLGHTAGIGAISGGGRDTPTQIGGCAEQYINKISGVCESHTMTSPRMWIGILLGGILTAYLMAYRFKLAIVIGITAVSIVSWPRSTPFTYFDYSPEGEFRWDYFKQVVGFHPIKKILNAQDWDVSAAGAQFALALFTFLYVDIIDCTATLYSMARFSGVVDPDSGDFPRSRIAYCTDAACISIGSLFGLSPVTAFVESGAGVAEGGKTGLTAITTGACFLLSLFFGPIFASIPPWATGCTLVLVGCMMMRQVTSINWAYIGDAVPAFVTLAFMPLSYSVAYGLIAGMMAYTSLNTLIWITKKISGGKIKPPDADMAEYWTYKPHKGHVPWFLRAARNGGRFWEHEKPLSLDEDAESADFEHGVELQQKSSRRMSRGASSAAGESSGGGPRRGSRGRDMDSRAGERNSDAITVKTQEVGVAT